MSFSNTDYLYNHLPARYRRDDTQLLLKRFLTWYGETFDEWDGAFDLFYQSIQAATVNASWLGFWLDALFGWSWFPWWFTLDDKRRLYGNFATHLARRGTRPGIEKWLKDFGIVARVHTRSQPWGEFVWGETSFAFTQPLHTVVEILFVSDYGADIQPYGEMVYGEGFYSAPRRVFTDREIRDLVRYMQPNAQQITIVWRLGQRNDIDYTPVWGQIEWDNTYWAEEPEW